MLFLVHSEINSNAIRQSLGMPEYSYYFVQKSYVDVLQELGRVILLDDPATEADRLYDTAQQDGEDCVFICFAPPHRAPVDLRCPTVCVFAWEFSNIPDEAWDDEPRNDWRFVLARHGRTICLSTYTEQVVKEIMGETFPVRAIPVPVYNKQVRQLADIVPRDPPHGWRSLQLCCTVIDNQFYDISAGIFVNRSPAEYTQVPEWHGDKVELYFGVGTEESGALGGFYEPELWGVWSCIAAPWVMLPFRTSGRYRLGIELTAYGLNVGCTIKIEVGGQAFPLPLTDNFVWNNYEFDFDTSTSLIQFSGLDTAGIPNARDPRSMGIGLRSLRLERVSSVVAEVKQDKSAATTVPRAPLQIPLDGIVYTSVFNPTGRKNWIDMLTAFCFAFRDEPRAVLLLKMTHHSLYSFLGQFHNLMQRIGTVKCRVVILHGFLDDDSYRQLIDASTYCVNTSHCEGLCLPLVEFMSHGIPAVAPRHTAMLDYVNTDNTFVIESNFETSIWSHDPRELYCTLRYRINWRSLVEAYRESFRVALEEPARYRHMSEQAQAAQLEFCSYETVREKLAAFFNVRDAATRAAKIAGTKA